MENSKVTGQRRVERTCFSKINKRTKQAPAVCMYVWRVWTGNIWGLSHSCGGGEQEVFFPCFLTGLTRIMYDGCS